MDDEIAPLRESIERVTEDQVRKALTAARGSVTVAAETLGVDRATIYRAMRKYGIEIERVIA